MRNSEATPPVLKATLLNRPPHPASRTVATLATMALFLGSLLYWQSGREAEVFSASGISVFQNNEYWRLATAIFAHGDLKHLLSNAMLFFVFAYFLFGYFGFWVFPTAIFGLSVLTNGLAVLTYEPQIRLIGASGAVYIMAAIWLILYGFIQKTHSFSRRSIRFLGVGFALMMPAAFEPTTSYRTHAIGFAVGAVFAAIYYFINRKTIRSFDVHEQAESWESFDEATTPPQSQLQSLGRTEY